MGLNDNIDNLLHPSNGGFEVNSWPKKINAAMLQHALEFLATFCGIFGLPLDKHEDFPDQLQTSPNIIWPPGTDPIS